MPEDIKKDFKNYIHTRNKNLHYYKAVLSRIERENRKRRTILFVLILPLLSIMASLSLLLIDKQKYIDKYELQDTLKSIIANGGDLGVIKHAFKNQTPATLTELIFTTPSSYYEASTPLSIVLNDLRADAFMRGEKDILPMLEPIISKHEETNPFDKLLPNQKDYFENLRIKTDSEYIKISNDVNNIADELHQKNLLVEEYLGDSTKSFWISIIAVILSLLIGGYQIFSGRPEAMKKLFLEALNGFDRSEDKGTENRDKKSTT